MKWQTEKMYNMIFAMRWGLCPRGRGVLSLGSGCGVDWGAPEAPPARPRTAGPPAGWAFDRAQPHRTESLRRPLIIAASSRWVSARSVHPQSRGPPSPPHRGGLSTRSCGSEASSFSPTAPRMDQILPRTGCVGLLRSRITCTSSELGVLRSRIKLAIFRCISSDLSPKRSQFQQKRPIAPPPQQRIEPTFY